MKFTPHIIITMKYIILLSVISLFSACSNYKLEIQQGNLISQESISNLKRGMTKQQVQALIGTSLMKDSFNNNRWDYVFYHNKKSNKNKQQSITLLFENDVLAGISK
jgi:outer membrane protein assembly factor BamE